jgi:cholesterol transport system auxiliary component
MTPIRTIAAALCGAVLLAGCVSFGNTKVPDQLISLTPDRTASVGEMASGKIGDAIVVLDPETSRRLDVQRVPVQVTDSAVAYLKDATWVERPARQFRRLLAETIRAKGSRLVVEGDDAEIAGKTVLSGRLLEMGYDARLQGVVLRFDALREDAGGTITSRRFEAEVLGIPAEAAPVGEALNKAANEVAAQVADWVG